MWETRSCSALILTSWERNVSPKETTSHSKKAREIAGTDEATRHIPLDEESSYLTTFSTPFGRYRFKRLPLILALLFHETCFKNSSTQHLKAADDKFVYGSSEVEHDRNLTKLMERAKRRARYSTKTKCGSRLRKSSFFFWHTRTPQGIKPDNKKVSAIIDMKPPKDVKSLP